MGSLSGLGIGLSFLFGCILFGLLVEIYYLVWCKKRFRNRGIEEQFSNYSTDLSYLFCWKKPNPPHKINGQDLPGKNPIPDINEQDPEIGRTKGYGEEEQETEQEEGLDSELMRLHNLCGPPRFLFTISEETREDLESEDGKSRGDRSRKGSRTRSWGEFSFTPLSSPPLKTLNQNSDSYNFNPLFESITEAEMNRLRSSPPPKFKFLRDAEEKLMRKLAEEAERRGIRNGGGSVQDSDFNSRLGFKEKEKEGSFVIQKLGQYHSTPSQVLPLASSPSTFRPFEDKSLV